MRHIRAKTRTVTEQWYFMWVAVLDRNFIKLRQENNNWLAADYFDYRLVKCQHNQIRVDGLAWEILRYELMIHLFRILLCLESLFRSDDAPNIIM